MTAPTESPLPGAEQYHLTVRFRPDGPAVQGTWASGTTAIRKFRSWIGTHATQGVTITLEAETDGIRTSVKQWPLPGERNERQ
ncbi:hypothetical protein [Streptomyces syringium]|uniref:hypothetical protein n=1 Tax=Streptomyces syringium TaxID=76729 RepID=UPI003AAA6518